MWNINVPSYWVLVTKHCNQQKNASTSHSTRYNPMQQKLRGDSIDRRQLRNCVIHDVMANKTLGIVFRGNIIMRTEYILFFVIQGKLWGIFRELKLDTFHMHVSSFGLFELLIRNSKLTYWVMLSEVKANTLTHY